METTQVSEFVGELSGKGKLTLKERLYKFVVLFVVVGPFLGTIIAMRQVWNRYARWKDVYLLIGTFVPIAAGVTVGYHRYFTHNSFTATTPLKILLGGLGGMSIEGGVIDWVTKHLKHHATSDTEKDPHSPRRGLFWAHIGWMLKGDKVDPLEFPRSRKLLEDKVVVWINDHFWLWVTLSLAIPYIIGGKRGFLWGGLVRIFLVHHFTWGINSICHTFGTRTYRTPFNDRSSDVWWWLLALGENYHNRHHAFQYSAMHGHHWWQDPSYWLIKVFEFSGLASNVSLPNKQALEARRIKPAPKSELVA